jgi:hypothetical protein
MVETETRIQNDENRFLHPQATDCTLGGYAHLNVLNTWYLSCVSDLVGCF